MRRPPSPQPPSLRARLGAAVLVLSTDPVLSRHLLSVVAAVGLALEQVSTDDELRRTWRTAGAVLVGLDQAERVNGLRLPARSEVYVVGRDDERTPTYAWSTRLRAAVATLPTGAQDLATVLSGLATAGRGEVLALTGGSGGVGSSTLAAALALEAAREGTRTFLLDADTGGGGIDVLLGAEELSGWRWDHLEAARGHLGDLAGQLPHSDGVDVLAVDRRARPDVVLRPEQVAAVLDSTQRSHALTVVDLPRHLGPAHDEVLSRATAVLLVVRADVRGVAAADRAARSLSLRCRSLELVVRTGRGHGVDPSVVADALDLPLAGVLEEDHALLDAAERGSPPARAARSALARLCVQLLHDGREAA